MIREFAAGVGTLLRGFGPRHTWPGLLALGAVVTMPAANSFLAGSTMLARALTDRARAETGGDRGSDAIEATRRA